MVSGSIEVDPGAVIFSAGVLEGVREGGIGGGCGAEGVVGVLGNWVGGLIEDD